MICKIEKEIQTTSKTYTIETNFTARWHTYSKHLPTPDCQSKTQSQNQSKSYDLAASKAQNLNLQMKLYHPQQLQTRTIYNSYRVEQSATVTE